MSNIAACPNCGRDANPAKVTCGFCWNALPSSYRTAIRSAWAAYLANPDDIHYGAYFAARDRALAWLKGKAA